MPARLLAILAVALMPMAAAAQPRLDAHGFPLPDGALARLGNLQFVAPEPINAVAMSPDGKSLASAGDTICIWNADTGRIVRELKSKDSIADLTWSRNGKLLLSMRFDTEFTVWNAQTGKPQWQQAGLKPASRANVLATRFIDNDRLLAIALEGCQVELWDIKNAKLIRTWEADKNKLADIKAMGGRHQFSYVALSPSGEKMAWLAFDNAVLIYETATGRLLNTIQDLPPTKQISLVDEGETLVCEPNWASGKPPPFAVVGIREGCVRFYCDFRRSDVFVNRSPPVPSGATEDQPKFCFSGSMNAYRNGTSLFTTDGISMVRWDAATGKKLHVWIHYIGRPAFSADGKRAVYAQGSRLTLCDGALKSLKESTDFSSAPYVHFGADGRLAAQSSRDGRLNVWDLKQGKIVETSILHSAPSVETGISYDSWDKRCAYQDAKGVLIHDLVSNRLVCRLDGVTGEHILPKLSADGTRVLVCSPEKDGLLVRWFETRSGRELGRFRIADDSMARHTTYTVAWHSANGRTFGYVTRESELALVDCGRTKVIQTFAPPGPKTQERDLIRLIKGADWSYSSPGFNGIISAKRRSSDGEQPHQFCIFDRATGRRLRRFSNDLEGSAVSADGRFLFGHLWRNNSMEIYPEVHLYETATGRLRGRIFPPGPFDSIALAQDSSALAMSCEDTTILIWDLNRSWSGKPPLPLPRNAEDADKLWHALGDGDPLMADPALWALIGAPEAAVPLLKKRLQPVRGPDADWMRGRIVRLDSANFRERTAAVDDLSRLSELAGPALLATLKQGARSLEQHRRIDELLARIDAPISHPACLRELRALEVLERIGSSEARKVIETLAGGDAAALLTAEARLVLARWRK